MRRATHSAKRRRALGAALLVVGVACVVARAQDAPAPADAPAPPRATSRLRLAAPTPLAFEVPTDAGPIVGTIMLTRLDAAGLSGRGRFDVRVRLDPSTVKTDHPVLDGLIARQMLRAAEGPIVLGATSRLRPPKGASAEDGAAAPLLGGAFWLDARRGGKALAIRYRYTGDRSGGVLEVEHRASLDELGLPPPAHPFVRVTGPVRFHLRARLVKR